MHASIPGIVIHDYHGVLSINLAKICAYFHSSSLRKYGHLHIEHSGNSDAT